MPFHTVSTATIKFQLYGDTELNSSFSETSAATLTRTSELPVPFVAGHISHALKHTQGEKLDHNCRGQDHAGIRSTV